VTPVSVSVATAAQDDVLHMQMLASDDATRTRAELGLKCTRVMGTARTGRQAMAAWESVSHMRSERSLEPDANIFPLPSNATELTPSV
jgi:hypothetical protein